MVYDRIARRDQMWQDHKRVALCLILLLGSATSYAWPKALPHYVFVLPNAYVGWIQIIFDDPQAPPLSIKDGGLQITVPESGLARTSNFRIHADLAEDEFYYMSQPSKGVPMVERVPAKCVLPGIDHGGFGVMDSGQGGKGRGYSWFIFLGPAELRAKVPLANWNEVVANQRKLHGTSKMDAPDPYPVPGKMIPVP